MMRNQLIRLIFTLCSSLLFAIQTTHAELSSCSDLFLKIYSSTTDEKLKSSYRAYNLIADHPRDFNHLKKLSQAANDLTIALHAELTPYLGDNVILENSSAMVRIKDYSSGGTFFENLKYQRVHIDITNGQKEESISPFLKQQNHFLEMLERMSLYYQVKNIIIDPIYPMNRDAMGIYDQVTDSIILSPSAFIESYLNNKIGITIKHELMHASTTKNLFEGGDPLLSGNYQGVLDRFDQNQIDSYSDYLSFDELLTFSREPNFIVQELEREIAIDKITPSFLKELKESVSYLKDISGHALNNSSDTIEKLTDLKQATYPYVREKITLDADEYSPHMAIAIQFDQHRLIVAFYPKLKSLFDKYINDYTIYGTALQNRVDTHVLEQSLTLSQNALLQEIIHQQSRLEILEVQLLTQSTLLYSQILKLEMLKPQQQRKLTRPLYLDIRAGTRKLIEIVRNAQQHQ